MHPRDIENAVQFVKFLKVLSDPNGVADTITKLTTATEELKEANGINQTIKDAQSEATLILQVADKVRQATEVDKDVFAKVVKTHLDDLAQRAEAITKREEDTVKEEDRLSVEKGRLKNLKDELEALHTNLFNKEDNLNELEIRLMVEKSSFDARLAEFNKLIGK